jgi:ELWxxDGT repeat protein
MLEDRTLLSAFLVKDINTNTVSSNPANLTNVNGTLFFSATDNDGLTGLWKSDGTAAGTTLVQEFTPHLGTFTNVNGELFFEVFNPSFVGSRTAQLWKSDGTAPGTQLVKDFTGQDNFNLTTGFAGPATPVAFQNELYFVVRTNAPPGNEFLWKSDGTAAGTVQVDPGAFSLSEFGPDLTVYNGQLFFVAGPTNATKLWKTDGTDAGTQIADGDVPNIGAIALTVANGSLYFFGIHDSTFQTVDLCQSDGTYTTIVQSGFANVAPYEIAGAGANVFFIAAPPAGNTEGLWVYDGMTTRELNPANVSPYGLNPFYLHPVNGHVVFNGSSVTHPYFGQGIWTSDGTDAGTAEITPAALAGDFVALFGTAQTGNTLYFGAINQLWQTDGTAAGTIPAETFTPEVPSNVPSWLTFVGATLFFTNNDGTHGNELWESNGTTAGTMLIKDINTNTIDSFPTQLVDANGTLYFTADDSPNPYSGLPGGEIWKSDGTAAGTQLVGKPFPSSFEFPADLVNANGTVFFFEANGPLQLWSASTTAGLQLIKDFSQPNDFVFSNFDLTAVGNKVFFTIFDGNTGEEDLWQSDGTPQGTSIVMANVLISASSEVAVGDKLYFLNVDPNTFTVQLWESDGTGPGTHVVDPNHPGNAVSGLTNVNGTLYYFDNTLNEFLGTGTPDLQLWKTDGTTATEIADVNTGTDFNFAFPPPISVNGSLLFFVQDSSAGTTELWMSNGMMNGTIPLATVTPDVTSNFTFDAVAVGGKLIFATNDSIQGQQLWVSDGTVSGTHPVTNISAGHDLFGDPLTFNFTAFAGRAFFTASDPVHGTEPWETDGTAAGTIMVQDINPGPAGSIGDVFNQMVPSGGALFFAANDRTHGDELWAYYPATHFRVTTTASIATPGSAFKVTITALDRNDNVDTAYIGTMHFNCTDGSAVLPFDYKFTALDQGVHSFTVTLNTPGIQTISATDLGDGSIIGSVTLTVPRDVTGQTKAVVTRLIHNFNFTLFTDQLIIVNTSSTAIQGPIQIVLTGLIPGVRLLKAVSEGTPVTIGFTASGDTIITLNVAQLGPGQGLHMSLTFYDPFAFPILFGVKVFSDSF